MYTPLMWVLTLSSEQFFALAIKFWLAAIVFGFGMAEKEFYILPAQLRMQSVIGRYDGIRPRKLVLLDLEYPLLNCVCEEDTLRPASHVET